VPDDLNDRVCVITGTARGVGRAAAELFARHGGVVVGVDINGEGGHETLELIRSAQGRGSFVTADVADPETARIVAEHCEQQYGRVDVLFNNAATVAVDTVEEFDVVQWNRVMAVNVTGPLMLARRLAPSLAASGHGSIINHSSIDGILGNPTIASYSTSKAALNGLTRLMAYTYGRVGIRANSICSGNLSGSAAGSSVATGSSSQNPAARRMYENLEAETPGRRAGTIEEAASVALFLASDASSFVNGAEILVTGGRGSLTPGTIVGLDP
jgi:NAD(P)-dependent dehydrogenase (short-subunit alcohol dehydrogenase family)